MAFDYFQHLFFRAVNSWDRDVPVVFIPTNQKPDMLFTIEILFVGFTQDSPRCSTIKHANNNACVLSSETSYGIRRVRQERDSSYNLNSSLLTSGFKIF